MHLGLRRWLRPRRGGVTAVDPALLPSAATGPGHERDAAQRAPPVPVTPDPAAPDPATPDPATPDPSAPDPGAQDHVAPNARGWSAARIDLADALWGEGMVLPGGGGELLRIAGPLGLSAAASLLLLGPGAAGAALYLAKATGAWVQAGETEPALLARAARRLEQAGPALGKRVRLEAWRPAQGAPHVRGSPHVLALEPVQAATPTGAAAAPDDALIAAARAVRPGGGVALVQTVRGPGFLATDPATRAWLRLDPQGAYLPEEDAITQDLLRLGLDVRVAEDMSERQAAHVQAGWHGALQALAAQPPPPARAVALVAEAELWLRRCRLLRSGALRVIRWHALAPAGGAVSR